MAEFFGANFVAFVVAAMTIFGLVLMGVSIAEALARRETPSLVEPGQE